MSAKCLRILLFLFGCMGARFGLGFFVKVHPKSIKNILAVFLLLLSLGFMFIYLTGIRQTGIEVFGDKIWWNNLRPLHSFLYLLASGLVFFEINTAHLVIYLDTIIGLLAFTCYHIQN